MNLQHISTNNAQQVYVFKYYFSAQSVSKIHNVILQTEKNLVFCLIFKRKDPLAYSFRMIWKGKLTRILQAFSISAETVPKIKIVILSEAKNLLFFFSSQKSKKEILRTYVLRMTDEVKLVKILEHLLSLLDMWKFFVYLYQLFNILTEPWQLNRLQPAQAYFT